MSARDRAPRPGYWAVIPAAVRYDDQIPANAKLLYAEISALTNATGYCYVDNAYFAGLYQLTERSVRRLLAALEEHGYILVEEERGNHNTVQERRIFAGLNPLAAAPEPLDKKVRPLDKKVQRHLNKINNIYPPIVPQAEAKLQALSAEIAEALVDAAGDDAELLTAWIDYADFRRSKRAPIKTLRTVQLLQKKLETLSAGDTATKIEILNQSIENSWTGLFELKRAKGATAAEGAGSYWAADPYDG